MIVFRVYHKSVNETKIIDENESTIRISFVIEPK